MVSRETATRRISDRRGDFSEATPEVADALAEQADPWPAAEVVDTSGSVVASTATAKRVWVGEMDHESQSRWERDGGAVTDGRA